MRKLRTSSRMRKGRMLRNLRTFCLLLMATSCEQLVLDYLSNVTVFAVNDLKTDLSVVI